jgi:hypothetical protein
MKKTLSILGGLVLSLFAATVQAQTDPQPTQPTQPVTQPVQTWDYKNNPTVKAITSQYEGKYITSKTVTTNEDIFPALGKFESTVNTDAPVVLITLDETNKGTIWIDGLPQGRIKAMLRKSPATYKIPAQKTADDKEVAEGTLIFDKDANTLNIVIGKNFNADDPALVFAPEPEPVVEVKVKDNKTKTKVKKETKPKAWMYTGSKVVVVAEAEPAIK